MHKYTADWTPLGEDVYYKKHELYCMNWPDHVRLEKCIVAAAQFAGPIALMRDDRKLDVPMANSAKPFIYMYSSAGQELTAFQWKSGQVLTLGWSCSEDLLCVQDDGKVLIYDINGNFKRVFEMGQEVNEMKAFDARIFSSYNGTGVAIMSNVFHVWVVNNVDDPVLRRLAEVPSVEPPGCWSMLTMNRQSRALVTVGRKLYLLDHGGHCQEQPLQDLDKLKYSAIVDMAISVNNKYLALFTDTGLLWIGTSDLQKQFCIFPTDSRVKPEQLAWCGSGAVVAYWEEMIVVIGPQKDFIKFHLDEPGILIQEMDCVRILTSHKMDILHKVPAVVEDVFKIGSMHPGAMLFEAYRDYLDESSRVGDYIKSIQDNLEQAVDHCTQAAGHEWEPATQKLLLRAASFGKTYLSRYDPEPFVKMCQKLRILNDIRSPTYGIPLTYQQLEHLTVPVLIDRLVLRRLYGLAIAVCRFLRLPDADGANRILAHWACYKVDQKEIDDDTIAIAISSQLGKTPGISYSDIANRAIECGRHVLAVKLLEYEARASEQVPLLMKLKKMQLALTKAIQSGDADLIHTVLKKLQSDLSQGEFFMCIRKEPVAYAIYRNYCRAQNPHMLELLYDQEDNYQEVGLCKFQNSCNQESFEERMKCLDESQEAFTKARSEWWTKQIEDEKKLLRLQTKLETEYHRPYLDLSLDQTIIKLIQEKNQKLYESLRKDYKITDKKFWWLRVQAHAEVAEWNELEAFSKSKKSPIGYEPFLEVCVKHGNLSEAEKYLPRITPDRKCRCLIKLGRLADAVETALVNKDFDGLDWAQRKCSTTDKSLLDKIEAYKAKLRSM